MVAMLKKPMVNKIVNRYYIRDKDGYGLHYIQGSLWWRKMKSWEDIETVTSFTSRAKAIAFAKTRHIDDFHSVGKISAILF